MAAPYKHILISHENVQLLIDDTGAFKATSNWGTDSSSRPGYDLITGNAVLSRPFATPQGVRTIDPDTLAEISPVQFTGWDVVLYDCDTNSAGKMLVLRISNVSPEIAVDVVDIPSLTVDVEYDIDITTLRTEQVGRAAPKLCWLQGGTNRYLYAQDDQLGFRVMDGVTTEAIITAPDPAYPYSRNCASDAQGRVAMIWNTGAGSGMYSSKIYIYASDLTTVLGSYVPSYSPDGVSVYTQYARSIGAMAFDPDGKHLWFYSGYWHSDFITLAPYGAGASPYPQLFKLAINGSTNIVRGDIQQPGGWLPAAIDPFTYPVDAGGSIVVYGAGEIPDLAGVLKGVVPYFSRGRPSGNS